MQLPPAPPATVSYRAALWKFTIEDAREFLFGQPWKILAASGAVFIITVAVAWVVQGESVMDYLVLPLGAGLGTVAAYYLCIFLALLLYVTPKKICQLMQEDLENERAQLERQRLKYKSDILAEKAAARKAMDERDHLQRLLGEMPSPPDDPL